MSVKQLSLASLLISISINGLAEDWTSIITKPDYEIQVDLDSYNTADGYPYIITKTIFNDAQTVALTSNKVAYTYHIKNTQFNCKDPQYKVTEMAFYNPKDKQLGTAPAQAQFSPAEQGTDEFSVGQLVCQVHRMVGGQ